MTGSEGKMKFQKLILTCSAMPGRIYNIMCSYFLPGKVISRLLKNASRRGVKIRVITAGPSDVMVAKYAERWMYDWLLRNKIELYEYQPNILHAKVAICDSEWLTIGSYNINNISAYASIELNVDVHNHRLALQTEQLFETHYCKMTALRLLKKNITRLKIFLNNSYAGALIKLYVFLFYIVTYNFKQRK